MYFGPTFLYPATFFQTAPGVAVGDQTQPQAGLQVSSESPKSPCLPNTRLMPTQGVASPSTELIWGDLLGCKAGGAKTTEPLPFSLRAPCNPLSNPGSSLHQNHRGNLCPGSLVDILQHELGTSNPCALDMQRSQKVIWK